MPCQDLAQQALMRPKLLQMYALTLLYVVVAYDFEQFLLVHSAMYCCSILFLKLSLGIFFLRFLLSPWQRSLVYMAMIVSTLLNAFYLFWEIFNCGNPRTSPARAAANKCPSKQVEFGVAIMQAAGNVATDIILTVMPVPLLWDTKMEWRVKVSVGFVLVLATTYVF
jgi:hypothetical protein